MNLRERITRLLELLLTLLRPSQPEERPLRQPAAPAPEPFDWFSWECEQYSETGAFWFNHWRYDGSPLAYPDPSEAQRRANWERCLRRAKAKYSEYQVEAAGRWIDRNFSGGYDPSNPVVRMPDPIEWAVQQSRVH